MLEDGLNSPGSRWSSMVGSCGHGTESSGPIQAPIFTEWLSKYHLFKEHLALYNKFS